MGPASRGLGQFRARRPGDASGYPIERHVLSQGGDALATRGSEEDIDELGLDAVRGLSPHRVRPISAELGQC